MQSTQNPATDLVTGLVAAGESVPRTLRDAVVYLAKYGWVQGSFYDMSARVFTPASCVVGAIAMVCFGGPVDSPAYQCDEPGFDDFDTATRYLDGYLQATQRVDFDENAYGFNDAKGRNVEEVIAVLHAAADEWDRAAHEAANQVQRLLDEAASPWSGLNGGAA